MKDKSIKVLYASHFGEPMGGISIANQELLNSSYVQRLDVQKVETSEGNVAFHKRGLLSIRNIINTGINIWSFARMLLIFNPDIIHIGTAHGLSFAKHSLMVWICRIKRVKVLLELHFSVSYFTSPLNPLWRRYIYSILQNVDGIITLSKEWNQLIYLVPNIKLFYVPNGIQTSSYIKIQRQNAKIKNRIEILFLGHIGREKGCFDLVDAIVDIREHTRKPFCLHLVGETLRDGEKEQLQKYLVERDLGKWVQVHDAEYGDLKLDRMELSDIFVLPSYHEGMPISILEAMAAGLPVIATKTGGITDQVIPEITGLLIPVGDVKGLGQAILRLIENDEERLKMGLAGRRRAIEEFDIEKRVDRLISVYNQLLSYEK